MRLLPVTVWKIVIFSYYIAATNIEQFPKALVFSHLDDLLLHVPWGCLKVVSQKDPAVVLTFRGNDYVTPLAHKINNDQHL